MRKRYSPEFKAKVVVELLREQKSLSQLASEYGVHPTMLVRWRQQALENLPRVFARQEEWEVSRAEYEKRIEDLYTEIGRLTTQLSWLKKKGVNLE